MREISLDKRAQTYVLSLPPKHARQVSLKLLSLSIEPNSTDSKQLKNSAFFRADVGEHRIIYLYSKDILYVPLIGKRNDNDVYRRLERLEG